MQTCGVTAVAIDHGEVDVVAFLPSFGIEGAGTQEDTHHVVYTVVIGVLFPLVLSIVLLAMLHDVAFAFGVGVEHLVDSISAAFACALAIIEGCHFQAVVAQQGVAQHKEVINAVVATCDEAAAPCRRAFVDTLYRRERGGTSLDPYELPIIIEVVGEKLS